MNNDTPLISSEIGHSRPLLLTAEAAANSLAVPVSTIKNLHRTGQLPGILVGKHLRFSPATLRAFVERLDAEAASTEATWTSERAAGS